MTSANIVGYNTIQVEYHSQTAFALQFTDVADEARPLHVTELVTGVYLKSSAAFGASMDQIWIWSTNINTWVKYGYYKPSGGTAAWKRYNANGATTAEKWIDLTAADVCQPGDSFLFYNGNSKPTTSHPDGEDGYGKKTITLAGGVRKFEVSTTYTVQYHEQQFMAYPWPVAMKVADIEKYNSYNKSSAAFGASMDQLWRWDVVANTWVKYGYYKPSGGTAAWTRYNANGATTAEKWIALDNEKDVVPAGQGFLFYNGNSKPTTSHPEGDPGYGKKAITFAFE